MNRLRGWRRRRWLAAAALVPVMGTVFAGPGGAASVDARTWWTAPVLAISAVLAGLILASYVPARGSGRLLEVGCSPCAVVAAAAVIFALMIRSSSPSDATMAVASLLVLVAGFGQRLKDSTTCVAG